MHKVIKVLIGVGAVVAVGAGAFVYSKTRNTCETPWLDEFNRSPELQRRFGRITWCLKVEEFTQVPGSAPEGGVSRWRFEWGTFSRTGSGMRFDSTQQSTTASQLWMDGEWFQKQGNVFVPGPPGPKWP